MSIRREMWVQHDGCPAHFARPVRDYLDTNFRERWIGRQGQISWPPRSPDLNPLDFFYWGCLKEMVYKNDINDIDELRECVRVAVQKINEAEYARHIKRAFIIRCRACVRAQGGHFEHLLI